MIATSPKNLSASFKGLNCFLKSSKANAALKVALCMPAIFVNGSSIAALI